ncbi:50S ribosomal protein L6 [Candidatus Woesearchaeota archaeon]|nr:MAG: 50S ribosomal protein L6 [Candidatus Woesearchaeota archaeon]
MSSQERKQEAPLGAAEGSQNVQARSKIQIKGVVEVPEGVTVSLERGVFTVQGPKGSLQRKLHAPSVVATVKEGKVEFNAKRKPTLREKKLINTFKAHLRNMFKGVVEGHSYELKVCSGHFPMTVSLKGDVLEVKNFIGESVPRTLRIGADVKVSVNGAQILVEGIDKEKVGRVAAAIEQLCRRPGFDQRVFQDGIYIVKKDGKDVA